MPLFHTKKDRMLKEKSKSTFDLLNNGSGKLDLPHGKALKKKSGSTLNLFATKSSNDHGQFPAMSPPDILINGLTKEHKAKSKSLFHLNEGLKRKSKSSINLTDSNNNSLGQPKEKTRFTTPRSAFRKISSGSSSSEDSSGKSKNKNQVSGKRSPTGHPASCKRFTLSGSTESMEGSREQRISDIAQLDNYIEYLKKSDDCSIVNFSNRLCCAQVLRLVLLRQEQTYAKDSRNHERHINLNNINNAKSHNDSAYSSPTTKHDTEPKFEGSVLDNGHLVGKSHLTNRNLLPTNQSTPSSSPETQRGERIFVRKGSNRKFKRSPLGQHSPSELTQSDSGRYNNGTSFREDDESGDGSSEDNFCKIWNSTSSVSLANSTSSLESPETEEAPSSPKHKLTVAVFSDNVEIY